MKAWTILLNALLVVAALAFYHQLRTPAPTAEQEQAAAQPVQPDRGVPGRLDANERTLSALETRVYQLRSELALVGEAVKRGERPDEVLSEARMAAFRRKVEAV